MSARPRVPRAGDREPRIARVGPVTELSARLELSAEEICHSYEELRAAGTTDRGRRREGASRRTGVFYTPPIVAAFMIESALARCTSPGRARSEPRLLDPACGAGGLLVAAARAGVTDLHGLDQDETALTVARVALARVAPDEGRTQRRVTLECADSLLAALPPADLYLANPPYVSSDTLDPARRDGLRECFRDWIKSASKPDLYLYFLARIGEAVATHRSVAAVIVPNRILTGDSTAPLRARLEPLLAEIIDLGHLTVFPAAIVHTVILILDGAPRAHQRTRFLATRPRTLADLEAGPARAIQRQEVPFRLAPRAPKVWLPSLSARELTLLEHCLRFPSLGETTRIREGLRGGSISRAEYAALAPSERDEFLPEFRGRNIRPFRVEGHAGYFRVGRATEARSDTRKSEQRGRKLVIPELAGSLRAAIQEGHVAYGGVYYVPDQLDARPLEVLGAYLSSTLATALYRALYAPGAWGKSLKLRARALETLPLPASRHLDPDLVRIFQALAEHPDPAAATELQGQLDEQIEHLFEMGTVRS